jgi:predicted ATPase
MIKAAFCGAPSTGKTTLLEALKHEYEPGEQYLYIPEAAREFFEKNHVPLGKRLAWSSQSQIQTLAFENEKVVWEANPQPELVFCDRTVLDAAAYMLFAGDEQASAKLYRRAQYHMDTYNKIYLPDPHDIPLQNDTVRYEDDLERMAIHQAFLDAFKLYDVEYVLLSGTLEDRVSQVKADIHQLQQAA